MRASTGYGMSRHLYLNVTPYLIHFISVLLEPLIDSGNATLAARVIISDKICAVFVDGIVGQVHTLLTLRVCGEGGREHKGIGECIAS